MYGDLADQGLGMIAVDISNNRDGTEAFYEEGGFEIPAAFDTASVAALQYRIAGTPTTYLLGKDRTIVWRHFGYRPGDEAALRARIERLLAASR